MALRCPRCDDRSLDALEITAPDGGSKVSADTCNRCGGVWLDGDEVAHVHPQLADLSARIESLRVESAPPHVGIAQCPRCNDEPVEFRYEGVHLDYSPGCHGLWIDGLELLTLTRATVGEDATGAAPMQGNYRTSGHTLPAGMVHCARCRCTLALGDSLVTSDGPMCEPCGREFEAGEQGTLDLDDVAALRRAGVDPKETLKPVRTWGGIGFVRDAVGSVLTLLVAVVTSSGSND